MTYTEIIKIIKEKNIRKILVLGPPRSGTTFASFVFAKELNLELIPEETAEFMSETEAINTILNKDVVFHANRAIYYFYKIDDSAIIKIMVDRGEEEIISSAKSFNIINHIEQTYYEQFGEGRNYVDRFKTFWNSHKDIMSYVLDYESLSSTKYWLTKEERKNFTIKQVSNNKDNILDEFI